MLAEVRRKVLLEGGLARAPALAGLARRVAARQLVAARFVLADAPELGFRPCGAAQIGGMGGMGGRGDRHPPRVPGFRGRAAGGRAG